MQNGSIWAKNSQNFLQVENKKEEIIWAIRNNNGGLQNIALIRDTVLLKTTGTTEICNVPNWKAFVNQVSALWFGFRILIQIEPEIGT